MLHAATTNADLLNQVKDWHDDEGWREFHRLYAPAIAAHAQRSGLTHDEAEDVVQTTMIKLATYLPKFEYDRTVCRFRTWLNQIVNQRILAIAHERRRTRLPADALERLSAMIEQFPSPASDPTAQAELEQRMLEVCLARVRTEVKAHHWQVFEASALLGMDAQIVAKLHHTSAANVWVIHHRLVRRLRTEWQILLNEPFRA